LGHAVTAVGRHLARRRAHVGAVRRRRGLVVHALVAGLGAVLDAVAAERRPLAAGATLLGGAAVGRQIRPVVALLGGRLHLVVAAVRRERAVGVARPV